MATYLNGKRLDNLWFKNEYELTLVYFGIKKRKLPDTKEGFTKECQ